MEVQCGLSEYHDVARAGGPFEAVDFPANDSSVSEAAR